MTPFAFDTLSASKQLREAGMEQGMAEAVVAVFQHAASPPDIGHLATKDDLETLRMATKQDLETLRIATKQDLEALRAATKHDLEALRIATKEDIADMATRTDLENQGATIRSDLRADIMASEARVRETIRLQGWALMGGVGLMLALFGGVAGFLN
ncbi:MAG: hypothetical protein KA105_03070 [Caulobacter sp.]|nr:hypothetical protein [Caulobacter sp.]